MKNLLNITDKQDFYVYRSVGKCLSSGISLVTDRFLHFLLKMLSFSIFHSLVITWGVSCFATRTDFNMQSIANIAYILVLLLSFSLLMAFLYIVVPFDGVNRITLTFRCFFTHFEWKRVLELFVLNTFQFFIIVLTLIGTWMAFEKIPDDELDMLVAKSVLCVFAFLLLVMIQIPMSVSRSCVALGEGNLFRKMYSGYLLGWKSWGKVFSVSMLKYIYMILICTLLSCPAIIMMDCLSTAYTAINQGDPVVLQGGYEIWTYITSFICTLICTVLLSVTITTDAYLYASLETDDNHANGLPIV